MASQGQLQFQLQFQHVKIIYVKVYILEGLIGPGVLASDAERKKAQDAGGCSNLVQTA